MTHFRQISAGRNGQTIVEALVAISLITIGLLGIVALTTQALSEERIVADNFRGSYLAMEGIEIARNLIDGNYLVPGRPWDLSFFCGVGCSQSYALDYTSTALSRSCVSGGSQLYVNSNGLYSHIAGATLTPFSRCVTITGVSVREIRINSVVTWSSRGKQFTSNVESHFFNWRPR